jgi:NitT/TauT family transport system permease protein
MAATMVAQKRRAEWSREPPMSVLPTVASAAAYRDEPGAARPAAPPSSGPQTPGQPAPGPSTLAGGVRSTLYGAASLFLLGVTWQAGSYLVGDDVLPGPVTSILAVEQSSREGYLWSDIGITAYRVAGAFAMAFAAALAAGALLGRSQLAERLIGPWVTIGASIPSLVVIVVVYLSVGVNDYAAMIGTALIIAPLMTFPVADGVRAINPELQEMARAFAIPKFMIFRRVILPQTMPFIFTAARTGLSLAWRLMIFVELLGRSSGVGYRIQYFYNLVDMRRVMAAALPFIALMLLFEFCVLRPLERRAFRWRRAEVT